ncbi:uncharacterized protein LOC131856160 [Cryptomeria japonica]|uniref:uncharacterized protein LOC131856160 n=1 Tax=Cryptomeria japonica TaxID=3369 RepID=UPI0027DAA103|nr:uncharacterized protein LOC131856160 [Cryptomeria japonica]
MEEIYQAAELGRSEFLNKNINLWQQLPGGNTALHIAAYHGHYKFVNLLLSPTSQPPTPDKMVAFLKHQNNRGNTSLHEAVRGGAHILMIKELLNAETRLIRRLNGLNESAGLPEELNAETVSIRRHSDKDESAGLSGRCNAEIESTAETSNTFEPARLPGELNAETGVIDMRNTEDESALFTAAATGRLRIVNFLLQRGCAVYVTSRGETPLHYALDSEHYGVLESLLERKLWSVSQADDNRGWTILHIAASKRNCPQSVVRTILEADPSLCYKTDKVHEQRALHIAAEQGNTRIVSTILKFGRPSVDIVDRDGRTALQRLLKTLSFMFSLYC